MLTDEQIAGFIIFPLAFIGAVANWTVALLIRKLPSLKNSFGRLTASQSIGDAVHSTVFAFAVAPMFIFGFKILKTYSYVIGHVLLVAYDISTYSHLCISLNRFCSIVSPVKYDRIFSQINTKILIILSWTFAVIPSFYLYVYNDCRLDYADGTFIFQFLNTPVCGTIVWYADFLKYNTIVFSIVIIDCITVSKVRSYKDKISKSSSQSLAKKKNAEMNFLKQACLQAFVFTCELTTYFLIMPRMDPSQKWLRFFLSTFAWVCVHMLDGIITLSFNKEFTQTIFRRIKIKDLSYASRTENLSNIASATTTAKP